MINGLLLIASLSVAQSTGTFNNLSFYHGLKLSNIEKRLRSLENGKPIITGAYSFQNTISGHADQDVLKAGDEMTGSLKIHNATFTVLGPFLSTGTSGGLMLNGAGTRFMWIPSSAAIRAGIVTGTQWDTIGGQSVGFGYNPISTAVFSVVSGGESNSAGGANSFVGGGKNNAAAVSYSVVSGGESNTCGASYATVGGGFTNASKSQWDTIAGGRLNNAGPGSANTVGGGQVNNATGGDSTVAGGNNNTASADNATVGGGQSNTSNAADSTVSGGMSNTASGIGSTVSGGISNTASGLRSNIGGGATNTASNDYAAVLSGNTNTASGYEAVVFGGESNTASGTRSMVLGGQSNVASNTLSYAAGNRAKVSATGSFGWGDSQAADLNVNTTDQFKIRAQGGFYVDTSSAIFTGVILSSTPAPSISCSAGTGVLAATATDQHGEFTAGAAAANCTITFSKPYPKKPPCICNNETSNDWPRAVSTTTTVQCISSDGNFGGETVQYLCMGAP